MLDDDELDQRVRDSLTMLLERHYAPGVNLELLTDSLNLACLPLQNCTNMLYKGDHVVIAEIRKDTGTGDPPLAYPDGFCCDSRQQEC